MLLMTDTRADTRRGLNIFLRRHQFPIHQQLGDIPDSAYPEAVTIDTNQNFQRAINALRQAMAQVTHDLEQAQLGAGLFARGLANTVAINAQQLQINNAWFNAAMNGFYPH